MRRFIGTTSCWRSWLLGCGARDRAGRTRRPPVRPPEGARGTGPALRVGVQAGEPSGGGPRPARRFRRAGTDELCVCDIAWVCERPENLVSHHCVPRGSSPAAATARWSCTRSPRRDGRCWRRCTATSMQYPALRQTRPGGAGTPLWWRPPLLDRVAWFDLATANTKIVQGQSALLDRLADARNGS